MSANLEYYRTFYYVAKYKNMTRAAEVLLSNQPNISRVMNLLENELGCKLINRTNRGIMLTPEGEKLYDHISIAFDQIRAGEKELRRIKKFESGVIYIGTSESALYGFLMEKLVIFRERYPEIRFKIFNYTSLEVEKALRSEKIDLAVVIAPSELGKEFYKTKLRSFRDILACGTFYDELTKEKIHLKEIEEYPLVMLGKNTKTFNTYRDWFLENEMDIDPDIEVATADLILPMIKNNLGIGFLPYEFACQAIEEGTVKEINLFETIPNRDICLITHKKHSLSLAVKKLIEVLKE